MDSLRLSGAAVVRAAAVSILAVGSFVTFPSPASAAPTITSKTVEPAVIPSSSSSGAVVTVRTDLPATSVAIDLAAGGTVPFVAIDSQTFSVVLTSAQLLFDYQPDDVNRNFVGSIKVTGTTRGDVSSANFFVNVDDASVADVAVLSSASDMRCAPHVVNLQVPADDPAGLWETLYTDEQTVLKRFYEVFGDSYDFANVVYLHPDLTANRDHFPVKNDVSGIGQPIIDNTAGYGSAGALRGITRFPLDHFFDLASPGAQHELGHQWINFLDGPPLLAGGAPHWPASQLARGLMGLSISATGAGGTFPYDFTPLGANLYELVAAPPLGVYTQMDLYLMGFVGPRTVPSYVVLDPPDQPLIATSTVTGTLVTIVDVIAANGSRSPTPATSPKNFRMATIVVTRTGFLTNRQLAFFDYFTARGEAAVPLAYAEGFARGTASPFALATQGIGSLDTSLSCPIPPIEPPPDEVRICKHCPPDPCTSCPDVLRGIDLIIYPEVSSPRVLQSLHSKLLSAGAAYQRQLINDAARHLRAFLSEIAAQQGKTISRQAASAITALTLRAAEVLEIPVQRTR